MDLKTFVKETLIEIDTALKEASINFEDKYTYKYGKNASGNNSIDFEVQVYASEGTGTDGGIGINVAGINLGTKGRSDNNNYEQSKISFSVVRENTLRQNMKEIDEAREYT
ncbi:hypothetical protein AUJ87_02700 [Candidatus Gracilibacteria bacterium CG1_02_38_174]|nr:MAG: hypothetical protein AUJ87_02700 [Candidatus Gracilibacteria bacterium CG1_02_38_174]PIQ12382.1 MAG: hypothetical protein COW68_00015 [Candidatus Gracilibacteria bacterium CG18_big_fil_WC_8_21_14_2_50_38_16]PIQ41656.1 MAG: hypothetical protein COW06_02155 [Candidatus Gracilibacteria bacterium CG12_big_fil_rev_8_21_14_0_65_38_15]PIZ01315.1 MAG: hypothetical protein COY60_04130 [Candidatus Gracilibacteria bacterium CG_4_10_14_0_8_um_filter_38_28]